ncbi:zinc-dependent alcohol dehydrogenase family protein [Herbiconiux sp. CPCC 205763]|uniref:Zinc-dependent alcohol dehydrogenase family protein n=1 Tax=Herbiconiux aconitum TaxID=2970913 RepID=A0ABT2GR27_9MICO|nr:zinc-dependent alcohol dehydrogenase family protein [Herbiconiux aconitum]MCS5717735.1 zinc-dependent alcohol dehydrogenase family protein [Herbiconiux aconitum]
MKALQIEKYGDPAEVLQLVELPEPDAPEAGEVTVQVLYAPLNHHDLFFIQGFLAPRDLPTVPGNEGIGRVVAAGAGVDGVTVGDLIVFPLLSGTWRERLNVAAAGMFPLPAADLEQLSMLGSNTPTAGLILSEFAEVKKGDWVAQDSANGGVGRNFIALAKLRGLRSINIVRSEESAAEVLAAGGDIAVVHGADTASRLRAEIGDERVAVAADSLGGDVAATLVELLSPGGAIVSYGNVSGEGVDGNSPVVVDKGITVAGIFVGSFDYATKVAPIVREAAPLVQDGSLATPIAAVYGLEHIQEAIVHLTRGGKILLRISK